MKQNKYHCRPIHGTGNRISNPLAEADGNDGDKTNSLPSHSWDGLQINNPSAKADGNDEITIHCRPIHGTDNRNKNNPSAEADGNDEINKFIAVPFMGRITE